MTRPNWGHGTTTPVLAFTEDEIRAVMKDHYPGNEGDCICSWGIGARRDQPLTANHLIEKLKERRKRGSD